MAVATGTTGPGSIWRRWDPHIHAPGTTLEDQFGGEDAWDEYLSRIEQASPTVEALGVTDYWSLDLYERVLSFKEEGRLPNVELLFPNVEIRFGVGTGSGTPVNAHLLISPEDPEHLKQARRFLATLRFKLKNESYACSHEDLIALGKAHEPSVDSDAQAFSVGVNQFKVVLSDLNLALHGSQWASKNVLLAVVAGTGDGTSGLSKDASLAATRQEIERSADLIFSGNPSDREFWLGRRALSVEQLRDRYDGPKPCIHGSDAHDLESVCAPDKQRYTWIKGDATFESLRQAVIEPETRVLVATEAPTGALPYRVIDSIELEGSTWITPTRIELNHGLVGIIGARGSGKTALADLIATGGGSRESLANDRSFLRRAAEHVRDLRISLTWGDGERTSAELSSGNDAAQEEPGVQYLSQQFVERLCSSDGGLTDELLAEIERVIFEEHPSAERLGTATFDELLQVRAGRSRLAQERSREALSRAVTMMLDERRKEAELPGLREKRKVDAKAIGDDKEARRALIGRGAEGRTKRLEEILSALERRQLRLDAVGRRKQAVERLADLVTETRDRGTDTELEDLRRSYVDAELTQDEWGTFKRTFAGDVDEVTSRALKRADRDLQRLTGDAPKDVPAGTSYLKDGADLERAPRESLIKEAKRLRDLIGIDDKRAKQLETLDRKISRAETALANLDAQIADCEKSGDRIENFQQERKLEYGKVFDALVEEERQLIELYEPLAHTLKDAKGALAKLTFAVKRDVNVEAWAAAGEELLDLRTAGPFKGHGALLEAATNELLPAWSVGSSADVTEAMAGFRETHNAELMAHSPVRRQERQAFWQWVRNIANWLDDTSHIMIRYSIEYEGVATEQLSPGTRGIVLLLLYLSVDRNDDRPLVIDQPEENLDPKSVFDELVGRFRETRLRRQVIVVTHNANLIVNTDADQVVVADAGPHRSGELPEISYISGGLENAAIRSRVCEILEGGEEAFAERARRLRVHLDRA